MHIYNFTYNLLTLT